MLPFEIIEHTADIGLHIRGANQEALFRNAASGLFSLITDLERMKTVNAAEEETPVSIRLKGENAEALFFNWLRELLFLFSTRHLVLDQFRFEKLTAHELTAAALGRKFDPKLHEQKYEVKAVTRHQFRVEKTKSGWSAKVIFDI